MYYIHKELHMAKCKETLEIEEKLHYMCKRRRIYGCEEVTIGFYNAGKGNEIVDFCTMDSKGVIRCYEIKVTLADLKSKAKKSWYGHYNYLVVTRELLEKIKDNIEDYIPDYVGVAIPCPDSWSDGIEICCNAKKQQISSEQELMMKESMIRSMSYKMQKIRNAADLEKMAKLQSELRKLDKENDTYRKQVSDYYMIISKIERALELYYGMEVDLEECIKNITSRKILLPESITLTLNDRGVKYNKRVSQKSEEMHLNQE